jgi:hypothetical protein
MVDFLTLVGVDPKSRGQLAPTLKTPRRVSIRAEVNPAPL